MSGATGQKPGQPAAPGVAWADLLAALVDAHGSLTAVAWKLIDQAEGDDVASIERALRRLRTRGQRDGGVWGARLLRAFGVPQPIEARLRWMGLYHSPFNDLPQALCLDQLRIWDRPPITESRARVWLHLGYASHALRARQRDDAARRVERAQEALAGQPGDHDDARIEAALVGAFLATGAGVQAALDRAAGLLASASLAADDHACFAARIADQRGYQRNRAGDHAGALAIYAALPATDTHPFASYRRDAGLAYGHHRRGDRAQARMLAERACRHAGDGGYVRLRAMGLLLLAAIDGPDGEPARARAEMIAVRLDDAALRERVARSRADAQGST